MSELFNGRGKTNLKSILKMLRNEKLETFRAAVDLAYFARKITVPVSNRVGRKN